MEQVGGVGSVWRCVEVCGGVNRGVWRCVDINYPLGASI